MDYHNLALDGAIDADALEVEILDIGSINRDLLYPILQLDHDSLLIAIERLTLVIKSGNSIDILDILLKILIFIRDSLKRQRSDKEVIAIEIIAGEQSRLRHGSEGE